jgi:hypothetical protein
VQLPSLDAGGNLQGQHWGRIGITFSDCNNGAMRWDGPPAWGSLQVPLNRLTSLQGLGCGIQGGTPPSLNAASGAWFDPAHYGSGFLLEQIDSSTIAPIWFGFDSARNPIWMVGALHLGFDVQSYSGSLGQGIGPHFGADYDPSAFHFGAQGVLNATFQCATAGANFSATVGSPLIPASLSLQRITYPLGMPSCGP